MKARTSGLIGAIAQGDIGLFRGAVVEWRTTNGERAPLPALLERGRTLRSLRGALVELLKTPSRADAMLGYAGDAWPDESPEASLFRVLAAVVEVAVEHGSDRLLLGDMRKGQRLSLAVGWPDRVSFFNEWFQCGYVVGDTLRFGSGGTRDVFRPLAKRFVENFMRTRGINT